MGYVVVSPDPNAGRPKPLPPDWLVRPTAAGLRAQEVWRPLFGTIEQRWQERFGKDAIDKLRESLGALVSQFDIELPDYLPILGYGLSAPVPAARKQEPSARIDGHSQSLELPALLSKVLLAFTIEFERESDLSLAIGSNVMRVVTEEGVPTRDLPSLTGISKEAIKMSLVFLAKRRYVAVEPDPTTSRTKLVRLTAKGRAPRRLIAGGLE